MRTLSIFIFYILIVHLIISRFPSSFAHPISEQGGRAGFALTLWDPQPPYVYPVWTSQSLLAMRLYHSP